MNTLICPISIEKINKNVVRVIGGLVSLFTLAYLITGNIYFMAVLLADFSIRAFGDSKRSPLAVIAKRLNMALNTRPVLINKAPKLFAARVGFLFSLATIILHPVNLTAAIVVSGILVACALLETIFEFCVGCVVYTYVVLPFSKTVQR